MAVVAIAFALIPLEASAHAQLQQSDPAPGAVLQAVPAIVTLIFTEPVTPAGVGMRIYSPAGRQVAGPSVGRGTILSAPVGGDERGTYVVLWQVYAADTHPSRGAFEFAVGAPSANPYSGLLGGPEAGTATPLGIVLQALARWLHFIGFAAVFGLIAYQVLTRAPHPSPRLVNTGLVLLLVAEPTAFAAQLASLSFDGDTALAVAGSSFGRILGLRLGAALLAWALIATERSWPVLAVGAAIAVLDGFTAHGFASLPLAGQLLAAVHVGAMGLWVGALVGFLRHPNARVARYAMAAFGVAAVTGLVLGAVHTDLGRALLVSDYGRVLILKVIAVGVAILLALRRQLKAELAAAAVVIAAATLLASLPPPL